MKKISLLAMIIGIILTAQAQLAKEDLEKEKKEIVHANLMLNRAIVKHDSLTLEEILAPNYALDAVGYIDSTMTLVDMNRAAHTGRKDWLYNALHWWTTTDTSWVTVEPKITVYGLAAKSEQTSPWKSPYEFVVTDIWTKNNGKWQILMRMSALTKK